MESPRLPDDLRERLVGADLLDAFLSLPADLQRDFIGFIESSNDEHHRQGRLEMVADLVRRSLILVFVFGLTDAVATSAMKLGERLAA